MRETRANILLAIHAAQDLISRGVKVVTACKRVANDYRANWYSVYEHIKPKRRNPQPLPQDAVCNGCRKTLPASQFYSRLGYLIPRCKACRRQVALKRYHVNSIDPDYLKRKAQYKREWNKTHGGLADLRRRNPIKVAVHTMFYAARRRARYKGLDFTITREWIATQLQVGTCAITRLPFDLTGQRTGWNARSPSLDRIDNTKGYTEQNCRVVLHWYNVSKGTYSDHEIIELMRAAVNAADKK